MALIKAMDKLQSQSTSNPNTIAMAAAVEALTGPQESMEAMRKVFEERRNLVVDLLNKAPGINCHKPEGAFYVYPSIHGCIGKTTRGGTPIIDDESFVLALLDEDRRRGRPRRGVLLSRAIFASAMPTRPRNCGTRAPASSNSAKGCTDAGTSPSGSAGFRSRPACR